MPEGEQTIAQLDQLTAQLMGAGKGADSFKAATAQVSNQLSAAQAATVSANAALAAGKTEYRQLERAALQTAKAAEKAAQANGGAVPDDLADKARQAHHELEQYTLTLANLETNAKDATAAENRFAVSLANVKKLSGHVDRSISQSNERLGKLQSALGAVGGPIGALGQRVLGPVKGFSELSGAIGESRASAVFAVAGFAALAAAIVLVTAAAVAGTLAIAAYAIGLADSKRNSKLASEAMEAMHPELIALRSDFEALTNETGMHTDELQELAGALKEAGVAAGDMPAALRAAALAETALGQGGSKDFIADIKAGKVAVGELSKEVSGKLGPIVSKQMMGIGAQTEKLKKNFTGLFSGLNIDPVLAGFETLVSLFDENTAAGQAMKFLFESVFQPLIDQAENAAYVVEAFALGFLIGLTKIYIAVKPAIKAIGEFLGFEDTSLSETLDVVQVAAEALSYVFVGIVGIFGLVGAVLAIAAAGFFALVAPIFAVVGAITYLAAQLVGIFMGAWQSVTEFLSGINLMTIGSDIIMGLVNGILSAPDAILNAITGVVGGAIDAAKSLLGISSPSKVFAEMGAQTGEGFVAGVEDTTGDAQAAMSDMVEPPDPKDALAKLDAGTSSGAAAAAGSAQAGATAATKSGAQVVFNGDVNFNGVKDAEDAFDRMSEFLTRALEGDAAQASGEAAAPP
jgi:hypothetical protein